MPWWPASLSISAISMATSVSGFCRPGKTLASLIGAFSGSRISESLIRVIRAVLATPRGRPANGGLAGMAGNSYLVIGMLLLLMAARSATFAGGRAEWRRSSLRPLPEFTVMVAGGHRPTLEEVGNVRHRHRRFHERLGRRVVDDPVGGPESQPRRLAVVPPISLAGGHAVDRVAVDVGVHEADLHQLGEVARADQDEQAAWGGRLGLRVADAYDQAADAGLVEIEPGDQFRPAYAEAIETVRAHFGVRTDRSGSRIKAHRVIAGAEHHAADAGAPRRFVDVVAPQDIDLHNVGEGTLVGVAGEVDDAVEPGAGLCKGIKIGNIDIVPALVGGELGWLDNIDNADVGKIGRQHLAQGAPDLAGAAGQTDGKLGGVMHLGC